jgi:hypothetical protein
MTTEAASAPSEAGADAKPWAGIKRSAGARMGALAVSAVLGIFITRTIVEQFGLPAYAQYGLLIAIGSLLPFADLGVSAAVMNAVGGSDHPATDERVHRVLVTAFRATTAAGLTIVLVSVALTLTGAWPSLLGSSLMPGSGPLAAGLSLALIGLALPLGVGQRILTGLGRNHISIALSGLQSPLVLAALWVMASLSSSLGGYAAVVAYGATLLVVALCLVFSARTIHPAVTRGLRDALTRSVRGGKVADVAWPMAIQMIALPMAMQSDRLVLSHVSPGDLATYNLAAQMWAPVWQVAAAAGISLWPMFAKARTSQTEAALSPFRAALWFGAAGAGMCLVLTALSGPLADLATGGRLQVELTMALAFSTLMIIQAAKFPLGMAMTDAPGMRFQALMVLLMLPVNVGLSIVLAKEIGAVGPVLGSIVGVLLFQVVANLLYLRRQPRDAR